MVDTLKVHAACVEKKRHVWKYTQEIPQKLIPRSIQVYDDE